MKLMLDTNVMIDLFCEREGFYEDAKKLLAMSVLGDGTLWACANSFTDIYYVATRQGVDGSALQEAFIESAEDIEVCSLDKGDILNASARKWNDFEDCLVEECANKIGADVIVTRDCRGFEQATVPAMSPAQLFDFLEREYGVVYDEVDF